MGFIFTQEFIQTMKVYVSGKIKQAGYRANGVWKLVDANVSFAYNPGETSTPIEVKFQIANDGDLPMVVDKIKLYSNAQVGTGYDNIAEMDVSMEAIGPGEAFNYTTNVDLFTVAFNESKTGYYDKVGG